MARIIFIAGFFMLTLLPVAAMLFRVTVVAPVDENRQLATRPTIDRHIEVEKFLRQADAWFTDHFGLRSLLIRLKTQIDYSMFGTSSRVHIGSGGWMFYRTVMDIEKPGVEQYLRSHEKEVVDGIRNFDAALRQRGIRMLLLVNLLADRFVSEHLPASSPNLPQPPKIDSLTSAIAAIDGLVFIDVTAILRRVQTERSPFHKTDFHWNDPGAFDVAREIVNTIGRLEGRNDSIWTHPLAIEKKDFSGGIATFMPLITPPVEEALFVKPTWVDPPGLRNAYKEGAFESIVRVEPPRADLLPPTVFVGDSFGDGIARAGFHAYFNEVYRLRWTPQSKISDIAVNLPKETRYVVVQFIEVGRTVLQGFANQGDVKTAIEVIRAR